MPATLSLPVRHNQTYTPEALHAELVKVYEEAEKRDGVRRYQIAEALDVSAVSIGRALKETGTRYSNLQARILEHLLPYRLVREETVIYRAERIED